MYLSLNSFQKFAYNFLMTLLFLHSSDLFCLLQRPASSLGRVMVSQGSLCRAALTSVVCVHGAVSQCTELKIQLRKGSYIICAQQVAVGSKNS